MPQNCIFHSNKYNPKVLQRLIFLLYFFYWLLQRLFDINLGPFSNVFRMTRNTKLLFQPQHMK